MSSIRIFLKSVLCVTVVVAASQVSFDVEAQDSIESRLSLPRLKLHCDPFIPVGTVRLNKNGAAKRDKFGNVIYDRPSAEEVKRQRAECTRQVLYGIAFRGRKGREEVEGAGTAPVDPNAETPTHPVLIGPPDDQAYSDPTRDMFFGMIWEPVPDAEVHVLCISSDTPPGSTCPTSPGAALAVRSNDPSVFADVIPTPSGRTTSVYSMPDFCYPASRCFWSVAACWEVSHGNTVCTYATPFFRVRVF